MAEHIHRIDRVVEVRGEASDEPTAGVFAARIIYFIFGVIIAFVAMRMALLLLAANQGNAFVDTIYAISGVFVAPFYGIFGYTPAYGSIVFDINSLVAIVVYALISWGLVALVTIGSRDRTEV